MTVNETIATMIRNWPTLYPTRKSALHRLFTEYECDWSSGSPISNSLTSASDSMFEDEEEVIKLSGNHRDDDPTPGRREFMERTSVSNRLRARRRNAEIKFLLDNADLVAADLHGDFEFPPSFALRELNRIPLDKLSAEWKDALIEFCKEIQYFQESKIEKYSDGNGQRQRYKNNLTEAKKTAGECLMRLNPTDEDKAARARKLAEVNTLAAELGYELKLVAK